MSVLRERMSRRRVSAAIASLVIGLTPLAEPASAQDAASPGVQPAAHGRHRLLDKFEAANTTHDGHLTLAQAQAGEMPMVARNFGAIDADHKGYITLEDIRAFRQARRAVRQGRAPAAPPAQ